MDLSTVFQIIYPAFWLIGFFLVTNYQRRIGFPIGLISVPMAGYCFAKSGLWGSVIVEAIATAVLLRGFWRAYLIEPKRWR
jgi:hypothetical protein